VSAATGKELAEHKLTLDDKATFEIDAELHASAILLRLGPVPSDVGPELLKDWPLVPERPSLTTFVIGLDKARPAHLESLRRALPAEARAGVAYVRFDPRKPDAHVLIVLPLVARD
jgi:hypothetical protein